MAIEMTRDEMIEDLIITWKGIQQLDPSTSIDLNQAKEDWQTRPNHLLEIDYNLARQNLWRLIRQKNG